MQHWQAVLDATEGCGGHPLRLWCWYNLAVACWRAGEVEQARQQLVLLLADVEATEAEAKSRVRTACLALGVPFSMR